MNPLETKSTNDIIYIDIDNDTDNDTDNDDYYCDDYDGNEKDLKIYESKKNNDDNYRYNSRYNDIYDDDNYNRENLVTCENCGNVWDGYAQCNCYQIPRCYIEEDNVEDNVEVNVEVNVEENLTENISSEPSTVKTIDTIDTIDTIENISSEPSTIETMKHKQ